MQDVQTGEPEEFENAPTGQSVHADDPEEENFPAEQTGQEDCPVLEAKVPFGQFWHVASGNVESRYFPVEHCAQLEVVALRRYRPGTQVWQVVVPGCVAVEQAEHLVDPEVVEVKFAGQSEHAELRFVRFEKEPAGHGEHKVSET
jgi:hypothetical protein